MLSPGSEVALLVDKPAHGGRMIARHLGQVVLVSGAIPGERIRARVDRIGHGVVYASTVAVIEPHADRRAPIEDWACGGQVYSHIAYERQLALKAEIVADAFARIGRMTIEAPIQVWPSPERGYRTRARLHVNGGRIGFFREGTHELCDAGLTGQLLPETGEAIDRFGAAMREAGVEGVVAIELTENVPASERVFHLELDRATDPARLAGLMQAAALTGLSCSRVGRRRAVTLRGTPHVTDVIDVAAGRPGVGASSADTGAAAAGPAIQVRLRHHARAFFQGNRYLLARLASRVLAAIPEGPVVDLYAGAGLFAVALATAGWRSVEAVESDPTSAADLKMNAAAVGGTVRVMPMPVEAYLRARSAGLPGRTAIVDPPRAGMSRPAMDGMLAHGPARVVYVSCDVATLARDVRRFVETGYALEHVEAFDLFPTSAHVEAVAVLARTRSR